MSTVAALFHSFRLGLANFTSAADVDASVLLPSVKTCWVTIVTSKSSRHGTRPSCLFQNSTPAVPIRRKQRSPSLFNSHRIHNGSTVNTTISPFPPIVAALTITVEDSTPSRFETWVICMQHYFL
jgi:hypothetical protein